MPFSHTFIAFFIAIAFGFFTPQVQAGTRLDKVIERGALVCGVASDDPGFSQRRPDGDFAGLEADLCRALAAAMLGSAQQVQFVSLDSVHEFLADMGVDIVFHRLSWALTREAPGQLEFGPVYFLEAVSGQLEMLAPLLHSDDPDFARAVRWSIYALMDAEAQGIMQSTDAAEVRRRWPMGETGHALGLDPGWAHRMVAQVGNYAEIFARNLGGSNAGALPRGPNRLWRDGGLLLTPLLR